MTRLAVALAALSLAGCISGPRSTIRHLAPPAMEVTPDGPLPVTLGIHVDPDTSATWWAAYVGGDVVPIGADGAVLVRSALERRFGPLADIPASPPFDGSPPATDLVLVPMVADFSTFTAFDKPAATHAVALRLALFDRAGHLVSTWTVRGAEPVQVPAPPPRDSSPPEPGVLEAEPPGPDGHAQAALNLAAAARLLATGFRAEARVDDFLDRRAAGGAGALEGLEVEVALEDRAIDYPGTRPTLLANGVVPVRVRITNRGPAPVRLDGLHVQLRLAGGRVIHRLGPAMAMGRLSIAASRSRVYKATSFGIFGALAATAEGSKERAVRDETRTLLESMTLEPAEIAPGGVLQGTLAFLPHGGVLPEGLATVELWAVDAERRHLRAAMPLLVIAPPKG